MYCVEIMSRITLESSDFYTACNAGSRASTANGRQTRPRETNMELLLLFKGNIFIPIYRKTF